jgi:hypothetical protein
VRRFPRTKKLSALNKALRILAERAQSVVQQKRPVAVTLKVRKTLGTIMTRYQAILLLCAGTLLTACGSPWDISEKE